MKKTQGLRTARRPNWLASVGVLMLFSTGAAFADQVQVWVQPSGDTFANAYALQNEARTYFGRAECNACGALEYKWDFSDGTSSGFLAAGDPNYIEYASKAFASFGTQSARLTVREVANTANTAAGQVNLQVIAQASDNLNRQKNSAIDRGFRSLYQNNFMIGSGVGYAGMGMIALENHGHNLQSPDSDIYKRSVRAGVQYIVNNGSKVSIASQKCIGDPEANDGDNNHDGLGIQFGGDDLYQDPIAVLALVNSADKAFAQGYAPATSGALQGMALYDIVVDGKDWLAWAQNDGTGSSSGQQSTCYGPGSGEFTATYDANGVTDVSGYFYADDISVYGGCYGTFNIDWGDGSNSVYTDSGTYCYGSSAYPELSYLTPGSPTHVYATPGTYNIQYSYNGQGIVTGMCTASLTISGGGSNQACSAGDAARGAGGWRYNSNFGDSDNSVTQWPVLALSEAKNRWGIGVNPLVVSTLADWLGFSQCTNGAFGYTSGDSSGWCNYSKGAAGLIMLKYVGKSIDDDAVKKVLGYLDTNWSSGGGDGNFNNFYGQYAMYKAMKTWQIASLNGRDWEHEYQESIVGLQRSDGAWNNEGGWAGDNRFATGMALAILAPEVASLPPVANVGGPYPAVTAGQALALNGTGSYHQDPARHIVKWQWDFDAADGLWWESKAAPGTGEGSVGSTTSATYPDLGVNKAYAVTLRVVDDTTPTALTDNDSTTVTVSTGNVPPVPVTNGPWSGLPSTPILFDASASYDPNAGDHIDTYEWDLNANGIFNESNGSDGTPVVAGDWRKVTKTFASPGSQPAVLKVTDSHGLSATSTNALSIVSIAVVYGQDYQTCYRVTLNRFEERIGLAIKFKNQGTAAANNLTMTLAATPSNLAVLHGVANLGTLNAGAEVTTACDPATKTAAIELKADRRIAPTGGWNWTGDFDYNGQHFTVQNIPPIGP